jgi:hypothetical protein
MDGLDKLASGVAKEGAAQDALKAALAAKEALENQQKDAVQAAIDAGETPVAEADGSVTTEAKE